VEEELDKEINKDKDILKDLEILKSSVVADISNPANLKRNKMLAEKQMQIKVNKEGITIDDILKDVKDKTITPKELKVDTLNPHMKKLTLPHFEKEYNKKYLDRDTIAIINFFKSRSVPIYVLDIKKEDTSDQFN